MHKNQKLKKIETKKSREKAIKLFSQLFID